MTAVIFSLLEGPALNLEKKTKNTHTTSVAYNKASMPGILIIYTLRETVGGEVLGSLSGSPIRPPTSVPLLLKAEL